MGGESISRKRFGRMRCSAALYDECSNDVHDPDAEAEEESGEGEG